MNQILLVNEQSMNNLMTSLDIAELTGKEHKNIMRDIRTEIDELGAEEGQLIFEPTSYKDKSNRDSSCYKFGKDGAMQLALRYDAKTRRKVIKRIEELEQQPQHSYMITDPIERAKKWIEEQQEKQSLLEENTMKDQIIAEYEPKVDYLDIILSTDDTVTTTQIAADYGMSARKLNETLHELGVQRKVGKQWLLYKTHMNQGYTKSHTSEIPKIDGGVKVVMNTKWTQKGRLFIYNTLKNEGYVPQGFEETNDKREV